MNVGLKIKTALIVFFLLLGSSITFGASPKATVLIYHKFNEPDSPSTSISTKVFEKQIKFLINNGYQIIPLEQLVEALKGNVPFPDRAVVITIDDGYKTTYTQAYPILKKYNLPFTVFLYMEGVGRYPAYMTVSQLKELSKYPKVTFGIHSYYHKPMGSILNESFIKQDTLMAKERFKKLLSRTAKYYAYPYGEYNRKLVKIIKALGMQAAFTQDPFNISPYTNIFLIPRVPMVGSWATLKSLKRFLQLETIRVIEFVPPYGILKKNPPGLFSFKIDSIKNFKNFRFYISELGWMVPMVDVIKNLVTIKIDKPLQRRINRVAVEAIDKTTGRKARFFYLIVSPAH